MLRNAELVPCMGLELVMPGKRLGNLYRQLLMQACLRPELRLRLSSSVSTERCLRLFVPTRSAVN
jgi:hypothetical protein